MSGNTEKSTRAGYCGIANMTSTGDVRLRAVIQFCVSLDKTPTQTHKMIKESGNSNCSRSLVFKSHKRFKDGRESIEDYKRVGRSPSVRSTVVRKVRDLINEDRRFTVRILLSDLGISKSTVQRILKEDLNMSKVSARWVPKLLSSDQKAKRVSCSEEFLRRYETEGEAFLDHIVTQDETWLWHYETKAQSSVWKTPNTPPPKKARVNKSGGKHMFVFFMDTRGMLLIHQVPEGRTINAATDFLQLL